MPVSGQFHKVPITWIKVNREARQRKEIKKDDLEALMLSMTSLGLINPITVDRNHNLIAGERRWTAAMQLGWKEISVQYMDELKPMEQKLLELEENVKRKDLEWHEVAEAIRDYCRLRREQSPDLTGEDLAQELNLTINQINRYIRVGEELEENEELRKMTTLTAADNFIQRKVERALEGEFANFDSIEAVVSGAKPVNEPSPPKESSFVRVEDALMFFERKSSLKYNLIHCDFPYGVGMDSSEQGRALEWGSYDDGVEVYQELLYSMLDNADNFMSQNAHILFWFSMKHYIWTVQTFQEAGYKVNPFPLVWVKSNNRGILPDPQRGPRQIYETALLVTRGDRKIVRAVSNSISYPMEKELHQSEKMVPVLEYFLSMLVDSSTTMLDPTCGSGSALKAALRLGADVVLGLEKNPEYARVAMKELEGELA